MRSMIWLEVGSGQTCGTLTNLRGHVDGGTQRRVTEWPREADRAQVEVAGLGTGAALFESVAQRRAGRIRDTFYILRYRAYALALLSCRSGEFGLDRVDFGDALSTGASAGGLTTDVSVTALGSFLEDGLVDLLTALTQSGGAFGLILAHQRRCLRRMYPRHEHGEGTNHNKSRGGVPYWRHKLISSSAFVRLAECTLTGLPRPRASAVAAIC